MNKLNLIKLKIKAKHLAVESAIIRKEENKLSGRDKWKLQFHRKWDVRNEARATQLAIAFLSGKEYNISETSIRDVEDPKHRVVRKRLISMVKKYGNLTKSIEADIWFTTKSIY